LTWTEADLGAAGTAVEWQIASRRADGSLRPWVIIWGVRSGDELYVRSAYGSDNPWYRRALVSGSGRIRAGSLERDVTFADAEPVAHADIDAAYHAKYDHYGASIVDTVVGPGAREVTLRLVPDPADR
jgi:hypothetical protein